MYDVYTTQLCFIPTYRTQNLMFVNLSYICHGPGPGWNSGPTVSKLKGIHDALEPQGVGSRDSLMGSDWGLVAKPLEAIRFYGILSATSLPKFVQYYHDYKNLMLNSLPDQNMFVYLFVFLSWFWAPLDLRPWARAQLVLL